MSKVNVTPAESIELLVLAVRSLADSLTKIAHTVSCSSLPGATVLTEDVKRTLEVANFTVGRIGQSYGTTSVDNLGQHRPRAELEAAVRNWVKRGSRPDELAAVVIAK